MGRRKGYYNKGGLGKAIGEPQTQTNRSQVVGVPGLDAFEIYLKYHPDYPHDEKYWSEVTMRGNTPRQRVSGTTGNWEVSYDNGESWIDLGVKAQGPTFTYDDLTDEEMLDLVAKVNVNAQRIPAVAPGALPSGPAGESRYMEVTEVGTWSYGGVDIGNNDEGFKTTFWWDGSAWVSNGVVRLFPSVVDGFSSDSTALSGSAKNDKILYDEINTGVAQEIPEGYASKTWNIPLSTGWRYYDSRCIVTDVNTLSAINIVVNNSGSIKILAIGLDGFEIHSETKTAIAGINRFEFSNKTPLQDVSFYPGVELLTDGAEMKSSTTIPPVGTEMWTETGIVNWRAIAYPFAYSIELVDGGLKGKIASLQIQVKSDTTAIQENLSKYGKITLDSKEFVIEETINFPSGGTLDGVFGKSVLKKGAGLSGDIINITNKEDVKISNIRLEGDLPLYAYGMNGVNAGTGIVDNLDEALSNTYKGTNNGINIKTSERVVIDSVQFHRLDGIGLNVDEVGKNYIHGMKASKLFFYNCYKGIDAINEHEFSNYSDIMVSLCQIGVDISSGNLNIANPIITRCRVGHILRAGFNNAHGIISNAEIKHHQLAGILIDNVSNGQLYSGLQMQYADLVIRDSKGIFIPDLFFTDATITCSGGTGKNIIDNLFAFGTPAINNTGNLTISNNINWNV